MCDQVPWGDASVMSLRSKRSNLPRQEASAAGTSSRQTGGRFTSRLGCGMLDARASTTKGCTGCKTQFEVTMLMRERDTKRDVAAHRNGALTCEVQHGHSRGSRAIRQHSDIRESGDAVPRPLGFFALSQKQDRGEGDGIYISPIVPGPQPRSGCFPAEPPWPIARFSLRPSADSAVRLSLRFVVLA